MSLLMPTATRKVSKGIVKDICIVFKKINKISWFQVAVYWKRKLSISDFYCREKISHEVYLSKGEMKKKYL